MNVDENIRNRVLNTLNRQLNSSNKIDESKIIQSSEENGEHIGSFELKTDKNISIEDLYNIAYPSDEYNHYLYNGNKYNIEFEDFAPDNFAFVLVDVRVYNE